jgi:hypothetical protein
VDSFWFKQEVRSDTEEFFSHYLLSVCIVISHLFDVRGDVIYYDEF